jgi:hypothetical protein
MRGSSNCSGSSGGRLELIRKLHSKMGAQLERALGQARLDRSSSDLPVRCTFAEPESGNRQIGNIDQVGLPERSEMPVLKKDVSGMVKLNSVQTEGAE